ncbi:unnamed protein product [Orchesella dallaii]|uniref:Gustatory receptor n=1 Tax=Orchesella dallaii TaxID=48710 RepID=A0ABP1RDM3_9HEXA
MLYSMYIKHPELFVALNDLFVLFESERRVVTKGHGEFDEKKLKVDYVGLMSIAFTIGVIPQILLISVVLVWTEMDLYFYLYQYLQPAHAVYYGSVTRFLLTFIFFVECLRSGFLPSMFGLLLMFIPLRIVQFIKIMDAENSIKFYTRLRLIFGSMDAPIKIGNTIAMAGSLIFLSGFGYAIIRSRETVSVFVLGFYVGGFLFSLIIILGYSTCATRLCSESSNLVQNWRRKMYTARYRSWNSKIRWKVWSAQRKLIIPYGDGLAYNPRTAVEYLYVLSTNIANLLLLF